MGARWRVGAVAVFTAVLLAGASRSFALSPSNVLVLYNAASTDGSQIAAYYAQAHPGVRLLGLTGVSTSEQVNYDVYLDVIRPQVLSALNGATDVIVTTKGLPLRIYNSPKSTSTWNYYSSLESELTRIDTIGTRTLMGNQSWAATNPLAYNPYYYGEMPFSYASVGTRLTSRLDGFSVADVKASIDRAVTARLGWPGQQFVVDDDPDAPAALADTMPGLVNNVLAPRGLNYVYDSTDAFVQNSPGLVMGYTTHGVYGGAPAGYLTDPVNGVHFTPDAGAVFESWESYNAYSFVAGGNRNGQALLGDWIRRGGTAAVGNVEEPGASSTKVTNEDRLFEMLLRGYSWAEAAWNATLQLSYVNTVVGDPLMVWRPWLPGDVNLDDRVDTVDLAAVGAHYGMTSGATHWDGDMNGDGAVNVMDLAMVGAHFGSSGASGAPAGSSPVPEPVTAMLLAVGALSALSRRRLAR